MKTFNINIEPTSHSEIIKFVANHFLVQGQSFEFNNIDEAKNSPIAMQLFHLPFIKTVYISQNFIALEKFNIISWQEVQQEVAEQIKTFLNTGQEVVITASKTTHQPVTVYAESTPNPEVLRFVVNKLLSNNIYEFKSKKDAKYAPLAAELFTFKSIKEIFISDNYVSITKYETYDWIDITNDIRDFIKTYLAEGKSIFMDEILNQVNHKSYPEKANISESLTGFSAQIAALLDEYVKPAVASDGGHIAFKSFDENSKTVHVLLQGACSGCPSSTVTLKNGIETMLKEMLNDQDLQVVALNG